MAPKILIAGSGPGALEAALSLCGGEHLACDVTLISPQLEFVYRPNMVMQPFGAAPPPAYRVSDILEGLPVTQYQGLIERVDTAARKAWSPEGDEFDYDAMIVATGVATEAELPAPAITIATAGSMGELQAMVEAVDAGRVSRVVFTAIPGTRTWFLPMYELALMTAARGTRTNNPLISIFTPESEPLEIFGHEHSRSVRGLTDEHGIQLINGDSVASFDGRSFVSRSGENEDADFVISMPRLSGRAPEGVPVNENGFIVVDDHMRALEGGEPVPGLFAIGDVTEFRVKQGGLASSQADVATATIAADRGERELPPAFDRIAEATLLGGEHRLPLRARINDGECESLPAEELEGASKKIHSRLLSQRLDQIQPVA